MMMRTSASGYFAAILQALVNALEYNSKDVQTYLTLSVSTSLFLVKKDEMRYNAFVLSLQETTISCGLKLL